MTRITLLLLRLAPALLGLAVVNGLHAQSLPDPTTQWQAATGESRAPGWQSVSSPLSLPAEFLPVPTPNQRSQGSGPAPAPRP